MIAVIITLNNCGKLSGFEECGLLTLVLTCKWIKNNEDAINVVCIIFKQSTFYVKLFT